MRRIVITGRGVVSPLGLDPDTLFDQLLGGVSAVRRISLFDPVEHPTRIAAEVREDVGAPARSGSFALSTRSLRFAWRAARDALAEAGLGPDDGIDPMRKFVWLATGPETDQLEHAGQALLSLWGETESRKASLDAVWADPAAARAVGAALTAYSLPDAAPLVAELAAARQVFASASACASGSHALADAAAAIDRGECDVAIAGGVTTPITRSMMPGFSYLSALSRNNEDPAGASRPFDAGRNGFIMSEGCGLLVLEEAEHARARGARIYGELAGWGVSSDSYRLTDPHPEAIGVTLAMRRALERAGVGPERISYVNAHGTSTKLNDAAETLAIKQVLGAHAYSVPVNSSKSMLGHMIHAAGAVEALVCLMSIERQRLHPTINQETPDPACDLDYVPNQARDHEVGYCLNNSLGFGGQNAALVLAPWGGAQ